MSSTSDSVAAPATSARRQGARAALVLLLAINLFNYVDRSILYSVAEVVRGEFHVSKRASGRAVTAFLVTYLLLPPVFGWPGDRKSRWFIIRGGVLLWGLARGASGLARSYGMML